TAVGSASRPDHSRDGCERGEQGQGRSTSSAGLGGTPAVLPFAKNVAREAPALEWGRDGQEGAAPRSPARPARRRDARALAGRDRERRSLDLGVTWASFTETTGPDLGSKTASR